MTGRIITADALDGLRQIESKTVNCCVTSPPYYGLRDYGIEGQIGLEETPEMYIKRLVEVFREVRRVLADDGTLWVVMGDSYAGNGSRGGGDPTIGSRNIGNNNYPPKSMPDGCKPKDLIGIPWMLAFALRSDGWHLRSDIIWHKPNPMPESVKDRPTRAHEYVFLFSKSAKYYYDHEAIKEPTVRRTSPKHFAAAARTNRAGTASGTPGSTAGTQKTYKITASRQRKTGVPCGRWRRTRTRKRTSRRSRLSWYAHASRQGANRAARLLIRFRIRHDGPGGTRRRTELHRD